VERSGAASEPPASSSLMSWRQMGHVALLSTHLRAVVSSRLSVMLAQRRA